MINIYTDDGWLNIPQIDKLDWLVAFIIGSRQVGKTYGTLKLLLEKGKSFIYLRRSPSELEFAMGEQTHAFKVFERDFGYKFNITKDSKYTYKVDVTKPGETEPSFHIEAMALFSLSHVRGFSALQYDEIVFDEFIPEKTVIKRGNEGDAFYNGYITLAGNRELLGMEPLRVWFLANANNLFSPILETFHLIKHIENMVKNGQEYRYCQGDYFLAMPKSEKIIGKRKSMKFFQLTGDDSEAAKMALNNEFSYNDMTDVRSIGLQEYNCVIEVEGHYIWQHKNDRSYYCCRKRSGSPYKMTRKGYEGFSKELEEISHNKFKYDYVLKRVVYVDYEEKNFWYKLMKFRE